MFRLPNNAAVINRYGFNSEGHRAMVARLRDRLRHYLFHVQKHPDPGSASALSPAVPKSFRPGRVLGINLGKNKTGHAEQDYVAGVRRLGEYADYLVVNVSSPNTPGLRDLQSESALTALLTDVWRDRGFLRD